MGDRVTVYVTVLEEQADIAWKLLEEEWSPSRYPQEKYGTVELELCEVNYANIEDESALLLKHGIPHTWTHDSGGCYNEGFGYAVFDPDGSVRSHTFDIVEKSIEPTTLLEYVRSGITRGELEQYIENHIKMNTVPDLHPSMVEFGKVYMLKQMVAA